MQIPSKKERLSFFEDLYERARQAMAQVLDNLALWQAQYKGDDRLDGSTERACATRNITYEIIESQIHSAIPAPKVDPACYSERRDRNAKSIERLCAQLRDKLPFEELNDMDERYTYIFGGSVWLVEWDATRREAGERGGVRLSCLSPDSFVPQPSLYRVEDMEYCFLRVCTTRDELCRRWQVTREQASLAEADREDGAVPDDDTVTVIICYYKDSEGHVCRYVWSGELCLEDTPHYYGRKRSVCRRCGQTEGACACEAPDYELIDEPWEILRSHRTTSDGTLIPMGMPAEILEEGEMDGESVFLRNSEGVLLSLTKLPYYEPRTFPIVIRRNTSSDKQLLGQSDCEFLRPAQQQINKVESRILQKLMRSAITPIVPEDAQITLTNQIFGQVIKLRPGESASDYGTVDTTPDISRDIAQAERLYDHAKRLIGISDTYVGLDNSAISGYSRQLQLSQSAGRLESKRRMKNAAYAKLDRLIFEYYLAYADEPRRFSYKDAQGRIHDAQFNRYDFLTYDPATGTYVYDDAFLFSVDKNGAIEGQRELMWEKNLENLTAGTLGDPTDPATLLRYWQGQERVHYPFARENVEYFAELIEAKERQAARELVLSARRADLPEAGLSTPETVLSAPAPALSTLESLSDGDDGEVSD